MGSAEMTRRQLERQVEARLEKLGPSMGLAGPDHPARIRVQTYRTIRRIIAAYGGRREAHQSWAQALALSVGAEDLHELAREGSIEWRDFISQLARVAEQTANTKADPRAARGQLALEVK